MHITKQITRANTKIHALRMLKKHKVPTQILQLYYTAHIEPLFTYACEVYIHSTTTKNKHDIEKIRKQCEKCISTPLPSLIDKLEAQLRGSDLFDNWEVKHIGLSEIIYLDQNGE